MLDHRRGKACQQGLVRAERLPGREDRHDEKQCGPQDQRAHVCAERQPGSNRDPHHQPVPPPALLLDTANPLTAPLSYEALQARLRGPGNGLGDIYFIEVAALGLDL